jgi:hypothetical protein
VTNPRPWAELRDTGLLWLINTAVLHPRGYALAIHLDQGEAIGWSILGDGAEPWQFVTEGWPEGEGIDDAFQRVSALLAPHASTDEENP